MSCDHIVDISTNAKFLQQLQAPKLKLGERQANAVIALLSATKAVSIPEHVASHTHTNTARLLSISLLAKKAGKRGQIIVDFHCRTTSTLGRWCSLVKRDPQISGWVVSMVQQGS